ACVVARREAVAAGAPCEREQLREAEGSVAADARVRGLTACVTLDEGADDRAPELLAQVEGHMREPEPVGRLTGRDDRLGRAARALGVRAVRIEPEPERDADRVASGAQQRDRAVDASAHRDGNAARAGLGAEDGTERVREGVDGERLAADRSRLEQRE